ncbi:MAG: hypothetical protein PHC62_00590 [Candidatus Izemoplasmatales bacterium]|nr:hypothetical protein [Candidatus Izemoplasmatales bacterium]
MNKCKRFMRRKELILGEIKTEEKIVYSYKHLHMSLCINPPKNRQDLIYIIAYNNEDPKHATRSSRIHLNYPSYMNEVPWNHMFRTRNFKLNKKQLAKWIELVNNDIFWNLIFDYFNKGLIDMGYKPYKVTRPPDYKDINIGSRGFYLYEHDIDHVFEYDDSRQLTENYNWSDDMISDFLNYHISIKIQWNHAIKERYFNIRDERFEFKTKLARISFMNPYYVHTPDETKEFLYLTKDEKVELNNFLSSLIHFNGMTNYEWLYRHYLYETGLLGDDMEKPGVKIPKQPNYELLPDGPEEYYVADYEMFNLFGLSRELGEHYHNLFTFLGGELTGNHLHLCLNRNIKKDDLYFIFTDIDYSKNKKLHARININKPIYVDCNDDRREQIRLNNDQKKELMRLLGANSDFYCWRYMINMINTLIAKGRLNIEKLDKNSPIPNYMKLPE